MIGFKKQDPTSEEDIEVSLFRPLFGFLCVQYRLFTKLLVYVIQATLQKIKTQKVAIETALAEVTSQCSDFCAINLCFKLRNLFVGCWIWQNLVHRFIYLIFE